MITSLHYIFYYCKSIFISHFAELSDLFPLLHDSADSFINIVVLLDHLVQLLQFGLVHSFLQG